MKYYALSEKINTTYGHGHNGEEYHICPKDAFHNNSIEFHPIFETPKQAEKYISKLKHAYRFTIVELNVYNDEN